MIDESHNLAALEEAPADYWSACRDLPWLPGSRDRLIFFYIVLDQFIQIDPQLVVYRSFAPLVNRTPTINEADDNLGSKLAPFDMSFTFLPVSKKNPWLDILDGVTNFLNTSWPTKTQTDAEEPMNEEAGYTSLEQGNDPGLDASISSTTTLVQVCYRDPGGLSPEHLASPSGQIFDFLSQGIFALREFLQGYEIASQTATTTGAYMTLGPLVYTVEVDISDRKRTPVVIWPMESAQRHFADQAMPRISGPRLVEQSSLFAERIRVQDPFMNYPTSIWTARRLCYNEHYYDAAVLHCVTAIEALLPAVWLSIQWEQGGDAFDAIQSLDGASQARSFTDKMLGWLSSQLGGHWDPANAPEVATFNLEARHLRNAVAHTGRRCERHEAEAALKATWQLEQMVEGRIARHVKALPRAAFLLLGSDGIDKLRSRGTWERLSCGIADEPPWFRDFASWVRDGREGKHSTREFTGRAGTCRPGCTQGHRQPPR